jgi:hypothetical protein
MLNLFAVDLLERYSGLSYLQLLSEATGTTERTWKNRVGSNWQPSEKDLAVLCEKSRKIVMERLTTKLDYEPEEAATILDRMPPAHYHCSQFLAICTAPLDQPYVNTLRLLNAVDALSEQLAEFKKANKITAFKEALLTSEFLKEEYWRSSCSREDAPLWRERVRAASTWEDLNTPVQVITGNITFSMFARWDLDFNQVYFSGQYGSSPLFTLVLPRLARNVVIDAKTGRFMRGNKPAKRNLFLTSTARLLELLAVLIHFRDRHHWPSKVPKVQQMAALFQEEPSTIVSWRDETTLFDRRDLERLWTSGVASDIRKGRPIIGIPASFLAASTLFRNLVVRKEGHVREIQFMEPDYMAWWRRHQATTCTEVHETSQVNPFAALLL